MVPDSLAERIVLFDRNDGALVDRCFIDGGALPGPTPFNRPINALQAFGGAALKKHVVVSSTRVEGRLRSAARSGSRTKTRTPFFRFDLNGVLLSLMNETTTGYGMDQMRGLELLAARNRLSRRRVWRSWGCHPR